MPPTNGARRDLLSAAGLAVLAVAYLVANRRYPLDSLAAPGPGVFPLAVGLLTLVLAGWQALGAVRGGAAAPPTAAATPAATPAATRAAEACRPVGATRRHPLAMAGLVVLSVIAIPVAGFLTASFVLVLVSSRLMGAREWLRPLALALGVTAAAYVIFVAWLGVPLPAGLLR